MSCSAPKEFIVNLDLPQEERWKEIGEQYADKSFLLVEYLRRNLPRGWLKPVEAIAGKLLPFFRDYGGRRLDSMSTCLYVMYGSCLCPPAYLYLLRVCTHEIKGLTACFEPSLT